MTESNLPVVEFDFDRAVKIYPRPVLKRAALQKTPLVGGLSLTSYIEPEWSNAENPDAQKFDGPYYAIIGSDGDTKYGSAKAEWESMHTLLEPGIWVKTGIPQAYQATEPCRVIVRIPTEEGKVITEAQYDLTPGQWVVCQPSGEVQRITVEKFPKIYFTPEEVATFGLDKKSDGEFATWALQQAATDRQASAI